MYEFLDRRYALALYKIAKEKGKTEEYLNELININEDIENCNEVEVILDHPKISTREKKELFLKIFKDKIEEDLMSFLLVLIEKKRIKFLKEKIEQYRIILLEDKNILEVKICSSLNLNIDQEKRLISILEKKFGKKILLRKKIDKDLIGGCTLLFGDKFIDYSLSSRIEFLNKE
ncbi:F0F1 ATP synthase subunit delta [Oceanirhabdus sp. W0125-5]|uniref:F0F1 ATP synthase subunit delta n=1 Tax=Oceanirhabdus sp. W0125-5 TaxID=2999116 RepID=UPI0022F2CCA6|nr:F0F1 ATP synthase subunit delta [Oceanirhabdus sp. W0125-5]WBW98491.1 F0F1 ATP synthase subunit delta [Oceanirhabdus sp. W0125-5]